MHRSRFFMIVLAGFLLVSLAMFGLGCGSDNPADSGDDNGDGGGGDGLANVDSILMIANDSLGALIDEMVNQTIENADSSFRPHDIDFSGVKTVYDAALAADSTSNEARFGAAFSGLMVFLADEALNDLYDDLKQSIDSNFNVFEATPNLDFGGELMPTGIPLEPSRFNPNFDPLRFQNRLNSAASVDGHISDLQVIFENTLLPMVVAARGHLSYILETPAFEFALTPAMQGDLGATTIYIDQSDFRVFLASTYLFEAMVHIFLSRNLDFVSYDVNGIFDAATQASTFLSLRAGDHMPTAKARLLSARAESVTAINNLLAEYNSGENQDDDLIQVYSDDVADLNEAKDSLVSFGTYFEGNHDFEIIYNEEWIDYWDGSELVSADTMILTVDISEFFDNPVSNPKSLIPGYTLALDTLDTDLYYICYDWEAANFGEWLWPNPTVNGLFPGLTADSLNSLFNLTENDWSPSECDTLDLR